MTTVRLIALCSPAMGSGKSTVAGHLVARHGFTKVAFATPLKQMTSALLGCTGMAPARVIEHVYGDAKEAVIPAIGVSSRRIQQLLGTEFGRRCIDENLWVGIAIAQAKALMAQGRSVVIDDMRFPIEFDAVQEAGGDCYRVVRPGAVVTIQHASEGQLDGIHMREIWNTGDLDQLYADADRCVFG